MKNIKRVFSCIISAMMITASMPAAAAVKAEDQKIRGNIGGYDYEMWNQDGQGQATMEPSAGSFTCSWSNIENFLARMGKNFDSQKKNYKDLGGITLSYDVEYAPRGNSYMCVYGWTRNPVAQYYIVEGWGDWRPPGDGAEKKGTVKLNGNTYDIYKTIRYNQPDLDGTSTFPQYWSVRQTSGSRNNTTNYMTGTVSVSKHFDAWSKAGLDMSGTLYEVSLNIEGYKSNGSAIVKRISFDSIPGPKPEDDNDNVHQEDEFDSDDFGGVNGDGENDTNYEDAGCNDCAPVRRNLDYKYETGGDGFKDHMGPFFRLGTGVSAFEIEKPQAQEFIKKNYNSITCRNEMDPDSIVKSVIGDEVNIDLRAADNILKFAEENEIGVRGHTFVWYSHTPAFLFQDNGEYVSKERMNKRLESMIKNTFSQLKSQFPNLQLHSYDVCTELLDSDGGGMRPASDSNWTRVYGEGNSEYVLNAFKYARMYAPTYCNLYLSDYNEYTAAKTDDLVNMVKSIMREGDYIDGIGMEAHLDSDSPSASEFETAIKKFQALGLDVQITELDISERNGPVDQLYPQIFETAMKHANHIPCVTLSRTTDESLWRYDDYSRLPFSNYQPKPFYNDIIALADKIEPPTNKPAGTIATTTTTANITATTTTTTTATAPAELKELLDSKVSMWGDANCDGGIDMSDAVIIMQSLANPNKYKLSDKGRYNGDVYEAGGGITTNDAAAIQKYLLGLIKSLPESYSSSINTVQTATTTNTEVTTTKAVTTTTYESKDVSAHQNLNYKYERDGNGFKDHMGPYFRLGTVVSNNEIGNAQAQEFIKKNYNSVTCEYEMMPVSIVAGVNGDEVDINLSSAENVLRFAEKNGIGVRGNTFVYYSMTPQSLFTDNDEFVSKERMDKRLESMIKNTFSQIKTNYPNLKLHSYDVCNELFVNDGGGMRPANLSNWTRVYGEDNPEFAVNAFKYARQYAPEDCKLYLTDNNEYKSAKTNDLINMAKNIMKEGDYIDGIGMQAHLDSSYPSASEFEAAIEQFESLGLDIQITELDITNSTGTNGQLYPQIFAAAMKHAKNISCVTLAGTTDERSWRYTENGGSPLPFSNYQPKSFYNDIITLVHKGMSESITTTAPATAITSTTATVPVEHAS